MLLAGILRVDIFENIDIVELFNIGSRRQRSLFANPRRSVRPRFRSLGAFFATTVRSTLGTRRTVTAC